ncbi:MAG TPA: tRNA (guanosine(37)-N1)-methyltransferase TrmD [Patescibacteria group bacterium]|nr:tRNA (guanosine(37)-N1)-methyltransferase TrmD [Patescibacteria group bacterium]
MNRRPLTIKIITLFPQFINSFAAGFGIIKRAVKLRLLRLAPVDLRAFGLGSRQTVDGRPYGGGVGMVLRADVLARAVRFARTPAAKGQRSRVVLLTPQGKPFTQSEAERLAKYDRLILVCGRYEGFDERARALADEELSLGDYILMGGELPALVVSEAVMRLRPGVLGKDESAAQESFSAGLLEYPQYTKPEVLAIKGQKPKAKSFRVPKVLLSGNHQKIEQWRQNEARKRTKKRRPDLIV